MWIYNRRKMLLIISTVVVIIAVVILNGAVVVSDMCQKASKDIESSEYFRAMSFSKKQMSSLYYTEIHDSCRMIAAINKETLKDIAYGDIYSSICKKDHKGEYPLILKFICKKNVFESGYNTFFTMLSDLKCFPIAADIAKGVKTPYENSWGLPRSYGGKRRHEGTDIMAGNNVRGYFPVISMTDGTVENMGWLELGGYRIGIRSSSGAYYYYAHLCEYADGIKEGAVIKAGTVIGTMGDSGYGKEEGTVGKFDVHLHMGIYYNVLDKEVSYNPYYILKILESYRMNYVASQGG